jgi:hypothetical protein
VDIAEFFAGHPESLARFREVEAAVREIGPADVRVTTSEVAFRRRRGFAYVWLPGRWLRRPQVETVLSIALPRRVDSARFREVAHPQARVWMHHLPIDPPGSVDAQVEQWLAAAYDAAG